MLRITMQRDETERGGADGEMGGKMNGCERYGMGGALQRAERGGRPNGKRMIDTTKLRREVGVEMVGRGAQQKLL